MERAAVLTIGDELLDGLVVDDNASFLARRMNEIGMEIEEIRSVPDLSAPIKEMIAQWEGKVSLLLITGGLGPTHDDRTKQVLMEHFGVGMERNAQIEEDLKAYLSQRGRTVSERDLEQADMPLGATILRNPRGSAPAIRFDRSGTRIVALPGVPNEMRGLVEEQLIPSLELELGKTPLAKRNMLTAGIGESSLVRRIEDLVPYYEEKGIAFAYLASPGSVRIRMMDRSGDGEWVLNDAVTAIEERLPDHVVGVGDAPFEGFIGKALKDRGLTVATAESCTGGYIAHLLTSVAGSSDYFPGSVIAYSNEVKRKILGVPSALLNEEGAVSEAVVKQMASGVRYAMGSHLGLATSGIMGPSGGTDEKPVGTVWMAVSDGERERTEQWYLGQQREVNIQKGTKVALNLLRKLVQEG